MSGLRSELPDEIKAEHMRLYGRVLAWGELIPGTAIPFVWGVVCWPKGGKG